MKLKRREKLYSAENLIGYVRYSGGALEVHEDYIVFYKNFLMFSWNVYGRNSILINIGDIDLLEYRGCGWFFGHYYLGLKHFKKPLCFHFGRWLMLHRSKKLNKEMERLYKFIAEKVRIAWRKESYRKIQNVVELKNIGICPICESKINADSNFCENCGANIK